MSEPTNTVTERITTEADGPGTVNERLSDGSGGTVVERLSGHQPGDAPTQSAVKAEWVEYAVSRGADRAEAESATKADLIEQYG